MLSTLHRAGSAIRNSSLLRGQTWLWNRVEPIWNRRFSRATRDSGYPTTIGPFELKLTYEIGARYDRADKKEYEPAFFDPFIAAISPGDTVIDVGAHVGIYALASALRVGEGGRVLAFEPAPDTLRTLRRHIRFNGLEGRIEVIAGVAGDENGEVAFFAQGESMANSMAVDNVDRLNPEQHARPARELSVSSYRLDGFCEARGLDPDVVKIDVEGAELGVLRGARGILERGRARVFVEVHPLQMENCGGSREELDAYLARLGYGIEALDAPNPLGIFHGRLVRDSR